MTVQSKSGPQQAQPIQRRPQQEPNVALGLMAPGKYEVTPDQTFTVSILVKEFKGRWIIADRADKQTEEHNIVFRIWSYEEMIDLRKRCTNYDISRRMSISDNDLLNRLKIQKLMVSWTFGKDNPRLNIQHVNGVLTDESWKAFTKLSSSIAERIILEMNTVLDYGG